MDVALVTSRDYSDSYTGYSDRPDLIKAWVEGPDYVVTDELVQHILDLSADHPFATTDVESIREELDVTRYGTGYPWEKAVNAIAYLLPPVKNVYSRGFNVVEEYEAYAG